LANEILVGSADEIRKLKISISEESGCSEIRIPKGIFVSLRKG
jgi:hypothetical protein